MYNTYSNCYLPTCMLNACLSLHTLTLFKWFKLHLNTSNLCMHPKCIRILCIWFNVITCTYMYVWQVTRYVCSNVQYIFTVQNVLEIHYLIYIMASVTKYVNWPSLINACTYVHVFWNALSLTQTVHTYIHSIYYLSNSPCTMFTYNSSLLHATVNTYMVILKCTYVCISFYRVLIKSQ